MINDGNDHKHVLKATVVHDYQGCGVKLAYLVRLRCRFLRVLGMIDCYKTILHSLVAATSLASLTLSVPIVPARVEVALCHIYVRYKLRLGSDASSYTIPHRQFT